MIGPTYGSALQHARSMEAGKDTYCCTRTLYKGGIAAADWHPPAALRMSVRVEDVRGKPKCKWDITAKWSIKISHGWAQTKNAKYQQTHSRFHCCLLVLLSPRQSLWRLNLLDFEAWRCRYLFILLQQQYYVPIHYSPYDGNNSSAVAIQVDTAAAAAALLIH